MVGSDFLEMEFSRENLTLLSHWLGPLGGGIKLWKWPFAASVCTTKTFISSGVNEGKDTSSDLKIGSNLNPRGTGSSVRLCLLLWLQMTTSRQWINSGQTNGQISVIYHHWKHHFKNGRDSGVHRPWGLERWELMMTPHHQLDRLREMRIPKAPKALIIVFCIPPPHPVWVCGLGLLFA